MICMLDKIVYIAFIMVQIRNDIISLHMHGDIALNGCEWLVNHEFEYKHP